MNLLSYRFHSKIFDFLKILFDFDGLHSIHCISIKTITPSSEGSPLFQGLYQAILLVSALILTIPVIRFFPILLSSNPLSLVASERVRDKRVL